MHFFFLPARWRGSKGYFSFFVSFFVFFFFWFLFPVVGPMVSLIQSCIHVCVCQRDRTFFFLTPFFVCAFFFYFALVSPVWQSTLLVFFFFFYSQLVTKQLTPAAPGTSCHLFFFLLVFKVCPAVFFFSLFILVDYRCSFDLRKTPPTKHRDFFFCIPIHSEVSFFFFGFEMWRAQADVATA